MLIIVLLVLSNARRTDESQSSPLLPAWQSIRNHFVREPAKKILARGRQSRSTTRIRDNRKWRSVESVVLSPQCRRRPTEKRDFFANVEADVGRGHIDLIRADSREILRATMFL